MNDYETVLFIIAILAICFILFLFYKIIVLIYRQNRLKDFGLETTTNDYTLTFRYKFLYKISNIIESLTIFNGLARSYDKYIDEDSKLRKGIDFFTIKILTSILFLFLYIFMTMLYKDHPQLIISLICLILGYIIPDFYCYFKQNKTQNIETKDLLGAIIIIRNSYQANHSNEQMLEDVINRSNGLLKKEFTKVLSDLKLGLTISEAFKRMYQRTNLSIILDISNMLSLTNKASINVKDIFDDIEIKLINYEKFTNELNLIQSINKLAYWVFLILPFIFIIFVIVSNQTYLLMIASSDGYIIIITLLIIYLLYIFIINKIVRGRYL